MLGLLTLYHLSAYLLTTLLPQGRKMVNLNVKIPAHVAPLRPTSYTVKQHRQPNKARRDGRGVFECSMLLIDLFESCLFDWICRFTLLYKYAISSHHISLFVCSYLPFAGNSAAQRDYIASYRTRLFRWHRGLRSKYLYQTCNPILSR